MTDTDTDVQVETDAARRKRVHDGLKPPTDRLTREPKEHPDRVPPENRPHPVTRARGAGPR